ncbi:MAG: DUF934 domain-containing protein [Halieaceae bacterium]|jgi:uncharacterized protein (DUF934 family)|nr:DUF934 domain-containing protein [Halieaceae bacterium]
MPRLIRNGEVVEDSWQGRTLSLDEYNKQVESGAAPSGDTAVQLDAGQSPEDIQGDLHAIPMIAIHFPVFTDGRGFSYARELRQRGYTGEIRAVGHFMRDQLAYLARCGVTAFQFDDGTDPADAVACFRDFSEHYQADVLQPEPLFRRR